jgi:hypothetical protein
MKARFLIGLAASTALLSTPALADDHMAACLDAASKGQTLKNTHKLVEAREQLFICAAEVCPAVVKADCAGWLADVEKVLPGIVLSARDGAGRVLVDVKVSADGRPLVSKLDGHAVAMNGGPHTLRFQGPDGAVVEQQVLVNEGEKAQAVAVVLPAPGSHPAGPAGPAMHSSPWKTVGWVLGGAGVVGLGVGGVFGVLTLMDKSAAHCDANNACDPGTLGGIKGRALVSDVGWIAGAVLLAGGAALVLFTPSNQAPAAGLRVSPIVTAQGFALTAGAGF